MFRLILTHCCKTRDAATQGGDTTWTRLSKSVRTTDEVVTSVRRAGVLCTTPSTPMTDPTSPTTTPVNWEHTEKRTNIEQLQSGRLEVTATEGDVGGCGRMGATLPEKQAGPENSPRSGSDSTG